MKAGAENRKKTVTLGALIAVAVCGILYNLFTVFGPSTPPPSVAPVTTAAAPPRPAATSAIRSDAGGRNGAGTPVAGVAAQRLASSSASLDPTLDQAAMLRTENLVYSGSGRNIFSATFTPVGGGPAIPKNVPPARPGPQIPFHPVQLGPPPLPPIPLKFFGTAQRAHGVRQAFLLSGDDVYLASTGDIVAKRFKVIQINATSAQVTDLLTNNTQTLPMQPQ